LFELDEPRRDTPAHLSDIYRSLVAAALPGPIDFRGTTGTTSELPEIDSKQTRNSCESSGARVGSDSPLRSGVSHESDTFIEPIIPPAVCPAYPGGVGCRWICDSWNSGYVLDFGQPALRRVSWLALCRTGLCKSRLMQKPAGPL